jgi:HK97 family phage major capsid protein
MHQELLRHHSGGLSRPEGILVPDEAFARSHVAGTPTLGGFLVENSVASNEFIEILRNKSQVLNLGARVLNLSNPTHIPRQNGAGTVNWVGESVASTLTAINFTNLTLTPKGVSAFHQYSKQLLITGNPSIDALIRDDITQTLALAIDKAALGVGGGSEPVGIAGTTGVNTVAIGPDGLGLANTTAYPALVSLEGLISADNADTNTMAFLLRGGHRSKLRTVARFSGTDSPVFTSENGQGKISGWRAEVSNQIATNFSVGSASTICSAIYFGDWSNLLVASFGATDLVTDIYTGAANAVVRLYARRWCDIGVRHPEGLSMLVGLLDH